MKINNRNNLEKLNFADFAVLETKLDSESKSITFILSGGSQLVDNKRIELGEGYFEIIKYDCISIISYNAKENIEKVHTENQYEKLGEICEIEVYENKLIIKGFAKITANWIEFEITGGRVRGEFLDL